MMGEESGAARENSFLFALGIDLDEIRRPPALPGLLQIQGGDPYPFARSRIRKRVQLARCTEREVAFALAVR